MKHDVADTTFLSFQILRVITFGSYELHWARHWALGPWDGIEVAIAINKKPVVTRKYRAGERARRKFIAAAMRLVAEQGVQGMSLRTLNLEAGAKNHSAVHYHFGTKNDVLDAALRQVFEVVAQGQDPLFSVLEERLRDRESISVREVVEAMYLPYVLLLFAPSHGFVAAKFVQRVVVGSDAEFQAVIQRYIEPIIARALPLVEAAGCHGEHRVCAGLSVSGDRTPTSQSVPVRRRFLLETTRTYEL